MLQYLELLAGYNGVKEKLLAKSFLEQNFDSISAHDGPAILLDFRFYNPSMTYRENVKAKLDFARKILYSGIIVLGHVDGGMLYKREVLLRGNRTELYYPSGLLRADDEFNFVYKFGQDDYLKRVKFEKRNLFKFSMPYTTAKEKFARMIAAAPSIQRYINVVTHKEEDLMELTIRDATGRIYLTNCLEAQHLKVQTHKEVLRVWSR